MRRRLASRCGGSRRPHLSALTCPRAVHYAFGRPIRVGADKPAAAGSETFMDNGSARVTEEEALQFHSQGRPGKIEISATKHLTTQRDLSLAYSPGVAFPCLHIQRDPAS